MTDLFEEIKEDLPKYDFTKPIKEQLVGEGKKFKDDEALAKGKVESDVYVKTLEHQLDALRSDYEKVVDETKAGASLRELIDQYKNMQQPQRTQTQDALPDDNKQTTPFDPSQLDELLETKLKQKELKQREEKNVNEVMSKLQERLGPNAVTHLKQRVAELDLDIEDVKALARKSPKAFFKTVGLDETASDKDTFQAPPRSNVRSDNFKPNADVRDWAYYEKMRKDEPKRYYDPRTQVQMHKDANEVDEKFGPGSFMRRK